jgi:hypothetical protein
MDLITQPVAPTSFFVGPDDAMLITDVYNVTNANVANILPATDPVSLALDPLNFAAGNPAAADDLRGSNVCSAPLPIFSSSLTAGVSSLQSSLSGGVSSAISSIGGVNALTGISSQINGPSLLSRVGISTSMNGIPGLTGNVSLSTLLTNAPAALTASLSVPLPNGVGVTAIINGVASKIAPGNITAAYQSANLINSALGNNCTQILDTDSGAKLMSAISANAINAGLANAFGCVSKLAGDNPDAIRNAAMSLLPTVIAKGSIVALNDIASAVGGNQIYASNPNILSGVSSNYSLPTSCKASDIQDEFSLTNSTFSSVNPSWDGSSSVVQLPSISGIPTTSIQDSVNLTTIQNGSSDFQTMMTTGAINSSDPTAKFFPLATAFPVTSPEDSLVASFPNTYNPSSGSTLSCTNQTANSDSVNLATNGSSTGYDPTIGNSFSSSDSFSATA